MIAILKNFGFSIAKQKGSHIKLVRIVDGKRPILTVPDHKEIDTGTLGAIFRQASAFIPKAELRNRFYSE